MSFWNWFKPTPDILEVDLDRLHLENEISRLRIEVRELKDSVKFLGNEIKETHHELVGQIADLYDKYEFNLNEIRETRKLIFFPASKDPNSLVKNYKFRPTIRSTSEIVQQLETRSYNASILKHENPAPEKVK